MRLVGTLENERDAQRFHFFLKKKGIETNLDHAFDAQSDRMSYQIWVIDEDRIDEASSEFHAFVNNTNDPLYEPPPEPPASPPFEEMEEEPVQEVQIRNSSYPLTLLMIAICALIYMLNFFEEASFSNESALPVVITPVQEALFFDVPQSFDAFRVKDEKGVSAIALGVEEAEKLPYWKGIYSWVMLKIRGEDTSSFEGSLFRQIRQGEVWRLFSPAILHTTFLHILFNMIWVWILSRPIEQRMGVIRLLILSVIIGVVSNVAQYLMSGPFFLGYSGVVMGLAGFTWMRERIAPWEGYPLHRTTILFLLLFVGGMFALQLVSFFLELLTQSQFSPRIANTAHIVGALIGALLGRLSFFSQRVLR